MPATHRVIHVEPLAPPKPVPGEPCNGCGVCCLAEPCPAGVLVTGRRTDACDLLHWDASGRRYRCGLVGTGQDGPWARLRAVAVRRWIGAGTGCDCTLDATPAGGLPRG